MLTLLANCSHATNWPDAVMLAVFLTFLAWIFWILFR